MPLYMDVHTIDGGVTVDDVAKAHMADLQTQGKYDVSYLRYWVDEQHGKSSASSRRRPPTPRRPCTARRTASSPTRSTKCRRGHELLTHSLSRAPASSLLMGQAVAASCMRSQATHRVGVEPAPHRLDCAATAKYHSITRRRKGRLFDLGRYRRNHLHRRTRAWVPWGCTTSKATW